MEATTRQEPTVAPLEVPAVHASGLRLVEGRTMREALLRARAELGDKAVVVDQRTVAGKVTLAVSTTVPRSTDARRTMRAAAEQLLDAPPAPEPPHHSKLVASMPNVCSTVTAPTSSTTQRTRFDKNCASVISRCALVSARRVRPLAHPAMSSTASRM